MDALKHNKYIGGIGERLAMNFYKYQGFVLKDKNVFLKGGELDIIMEKEGILYFIEVKTVQENKFNAIDNFTPKKARNMRRAIELYLHMSKNTDKQIQIDLACITLLDSFFQKVAPNKSDFIIEIFENIILD